MKKRRKKHHHVSAGQIANTTAQITQEMCAMCGSLDKLRRLLVKDAPQPTRCPDNWHNS